MSRSWSSQFDSRFRYVRSPHTWRSRFAAGADGRSAAGEKPVKSLSKEEIEAVIERYVRGNEK